MLMHAEVVAIRKQSAESVVVTAATEISDGVETAGIEIGGEVATAAAEISGESVKVATETVEKVMAGHMEEMDPDGMLDTATEDIIMLGDTEPDLILLDIPDGQTI